MDDPLLMRLIEPFHDLDGQLYSVFEAMKIELLSHVRYSNLSENDGLFPADKIICDVCKAHDVDWRYKRDRIAFFQAVLDSMENPYE